MKYSDGIAITQGDDTNALENSILFLLETDLDLTGYHAVFQTRSFRREWSDITSKSLPLVLSREETIKFCPGTQYGALKIYDNNNLAVTVIRNIPIYIKPLVVENEDDEDDE